ncbi:serine/threonine-protein kinase [Thermobispora bispora]|uniref:Serine/threonine protein kinase n=1 Tax=Thermobispora bispora (strain ATCC 19993 / DSM 43833 / CBS 139.67 / JCM 10125 / KCTC 9307 / NBRC 14880 / R51) TaxID=469371 RepID=D6Y6Q5_THEBD|nr:serine/threonine-protein kinase [Thermobispora bispora]ADG89546.1 serine/threonine protein kinase [Thermobispora bispora DSM 43833]
MGAPEQLDRYRLLSTLGSGGFGEVYLGLDPEGHTVAIKVLHPHVAADSLALARLAREVETMRRVRGPHVAEILDASLTGPRPYLVTRYIQGRPLSTVIAEDGPIQGDGLVRLARGLARALASIHAAGVVHRDLKPANVILADGEPYVIDFGIAYALESASVTASGLVVGTPGYLAPEVIDGEAAGPEADVFALGATLAFAATGRQPYGTGPPTAVAYRVVHHDPDLSGVPPWLAAILVDCMAADPAARPTAAEVVARIEAEVRGNAAAAQSAPPRRAVPRTRTLPARNPADEPTREWRPGGRPPSAAEEARRRHRRKVHRRWIIGSALVVGLFASAARTHLPELSLLLLVLYGLVVLADAGLGMFERARDRVLTDAVGGTGAVAVWALLSSLFSTTTLLLAVGAVLAVLIGLVAAG